MGNVEELLLSTNNGTFTSNNLWLHQVCGRNLEVRHHFKSKSMVTCCHFAAPHPPHTHNTHLPATELSHSASNKAPRMHNYYSVVNRPYQVQAGCNPKAILRVGFQNVAPTLPLHMIQSLLLNRRKTFLGESSKNFGIGSGPVQLQGEKQEPWNRSWGHRTWCLQIPMECTKNVKDLKSNEDINRNALELWALLYPTGLDLDLSIVGTSQQSVSPVGRSNMAPAADKILHKSTQVSQDSYKIFVWSQWNPSNAHC